MRCIFKKIIVKGIIIFIFSFFLFFIKIAFFDKVYAEPLKMRGESLIQERCTLCHGLEQVNKEKANADRNFWEGTLDEMAEKGAKANKEERQAIIDFLLKSKSDSKNE